MFVPGHMMETRKWQRGWNYDDNGLIYVRQSKYCGLGWMDAVGTRLDKGLASGVVRRATFNDLARGMIGEITPEVVFARLDRRLNAQHAGVPRWNDPKLDQPPPKIKPLKFYCD